ncbi:MAG: hypothetical protein HPY90_14960 [Syntrophothermus sp.]|uniref:VPA1262 family N-terminal domain-containing protein n=1 Tax=Syntrophothermus sp. TaxID=2736299 RepID=UPI00258036F0|nr:VPA1262 family N-terminal domain-containing protein [Syntrophothermus sp.]NSW84511.1 hypothetical protein [Syntrophothermus sp.]
MGELIEKFRRFATSGEVGLYNSCSITSVVLTSRKDRLHRNVFTIAVFEELPFRNDRLRYHTERPVRISKDLSLGVVSQRVTVDDAVNLYERLARKGRWQQPSCPELQVAKLTPLEPVFVPCTPGVPIHGVLKNPHRYASYLFEFFSEQKELYRELNPNYFRGDVTSLQRKVNSAVQDVIPIDLEFIEDRWENIIFQFPVNLLKVDVWGDRDGKHIWVATRWHPELERSRQEVRIESWVTFDETILGRTAVTTAEPLTRLHVGSTAGRITVRISTKSGEITLYEKSLHLVNRVAISVRLVHPEKITINVPPYGKRRPGFSYTVQPVSGDVVKAGAFSDWRTWVSKRVNLASKRALERRLEFVQYGVGGRNEWTRALSDLRQLITWHGENGVYLWDPYATANDILATLFACEFSGVPLRVITSYSKQVKGLAADGVKICSYQDWVAYLKGELAEALKQRKVNLEVRCQHGRHGWKFHDRFLLFPGREPKVWSLGCSVNALGLSHSILMKVAHPRPVLEAFENLWEALAQCIVWP